MYPSIIRVGISFIEIRLTIFFTLNKIKNNISKHSIKFKPPFKHALNKKNRVVNNDFELTIFRSHSCLVPIKLN